MGEVDPKLIEIGYKSATERQSWTCLQDHPNGSLRASCRDCGECRPCNFFSVSQGVSCGSRVGVDMYAHGPRCPDHAHIFFNYFKPSS